ncbi:MAG: diacylglycerol kinase family protein [Planctomycetaceae bacterium]|jgi:diacylglycerol kinase|nr:diacylglycerol kinase family protein [Planctomycetaceae bacterium]
MRRKNLRLRRIKRNRQTIKQIPFTQDKRTWSNKFKDAFLGLASSFKGQSSYHVHFAAAIVVILASFLIGNFDAIRWSIIILCIAIVITTEMLNTSIENLAKAITTTYNPKIALALDIASGAVLLVSFGAAIVGIILFTESIFKFFTVS